MSQDPVEVIREQYAATNARDFERAMTCYLVFMTATYGGTGRTSGAEAHDTRSYLYRVADGRITRVQLFLTPKSAMEAAFLPEWSGPQNG